MNKNLVFLNIETLLADIFELVYHNQLVGTLDTENLLEFILIKEVKQKSAYAN